MRISFKGKTVDEPEINAGFIGCGSHSFRNLYPVFQFAPVNLVAVCDLNVQTAEAFAAKFGVRSVYSSYHQMVDNANLDAVFICTGYDDRGRPQYPQLTVDCLKSGCHVWIEKPPAASCAEIVRMQKTANSTKKNVVVGLKKMFSPANEKAYELMKSPDFGEPNLVTLQYPLYVPSVEELTDYFQNTRANSVVGFLDHICHPVSLLVYLLGLPESLYYERSNNGAGLATFHYASGTIASIALTNGASWNSGIERTTIISNRGQHIAVENNTRVTLHRTPPLGYGDFPSFYTGIPEQTSAVWDPEFSLGQLYNKGLFLLGYYNEVNEFARSILENRPPSKGTLQQAWQVTRVFEAFAEGPGKRILLGPDNPSKDGIG
ncbi:MAG: Gfo/Idh/MocA family oxidoreductase [Anaerolineaceae bacterium]|nr:Gfo/Idh/MocA family oxidoreductase [Anaerolineaceae bacterium]